jgi:hypothetical protein
MNEERNLKNIKVKGYGFTEERHGQTEERQFNLKDMLLNYSNYDLRAEGVYRSYGFMYDFKPFLKKYIIKTQYNIIECFALNKTFIRQNKGLYVEGHIYYIIEVFK